MVGFHCKGCLFFERINVEINPTAGHPRWSRRTAKLNGSFEPAASNRARTSGLVWLSGREGERCALRDASQDAWAACEGFELK